jgi:hypothetical protein
MKLLLALLVTIIIFPGCQKLMEYYDVKGEKKPPACRIISQSYVDLEGDSVATVYSYNADGTPASISYPDLDVGTHYEDFTYDNLGRLIHRSQYIYAGEDQTYIYEGNSKLPIGDTAIDIWGRKWFETFGYDDLGRIISEARKWVWSPEGLDEALGEDPASYAVEVRRYRYDVRGNRQPTIFDITPQEPFVYSDKPSFYSLNRVWQLIYRNYSKNSVETSQVKTYNEYGLPVTYYESSAVTEYECH